MELDVNNILSSDEIENLFTDDGEEESQVTPPAKEEDNKTETTETQEIDPEELFDESEGVGSVEDTQGKENTASEKDGTSPKNNFYSSIANALKDEGILPDLENVDDIKTPEDFAEAMEKHIQAKFDERQKRIDEALQVGVEPDDIRKYENTIRYLESLKEEVITDESKEGENLRKQLIYQDFVNRGYSKERAAREVQKSFNAGSDIEDAKEALASNKEYFSSEYQELINEAKEQEEERKKEIAETAESLKKSILEEKEIFKGIELDKETRVKVYNSVSKPVYKDPESGEYLTAIQKYERDNKVDFMKKVGLLFTMTDGFTNLDKLIKPKVKKEVKNSLRELEHTINNTRRTSSGSLNFISGVSDDPDSKSNFELDI